MKVSEMNARQKKAYRNIYHAAEQIIGGLENTMLDFPENTEEHQRAKASLEEHDGLVKMIYTEAISTIYDDGFCSWGPNAEKYLKDIRFCGREWLVARCEARVKKMGY